MKPFDTSNKTPRYIQTALETKVFYIGDTSDGKPVIEFERRTGQYISVDPKLIFELPVKKTYWVNVYLKDGILSAAHLYDTEQIAKNTAYSKNYISTVSIELEV